MEWTLCGHGSVCRHADEVLEILRPAVGLTRHDVIRDDYCPAPRVLRMPWFFSHPERSQSSRAD